MWAPRQQHEKCRVPGLTQTPSAAPGMTVRPFPCWEPEPGSAELLPAPILQEEREGASLYGNGDLKRSAAERPGAA